MSDTAPEDRLSPALLAPLRGLVPLHTRVGIRRSAADLERWLILSRVVFKTPKVDLFERQGAWEAARALRSCAEAHDLRLSLRTTGEAAPPASELLSEIRPMDFCITPAEVNPASLETWIRTAEAARLPLRVQLPAGAALAAHALLPALLSPAVAAVAFVCEDPLLDPLPSAPLSQADATLKTLFDMAARLVAQQKDVALLGVPYGLVPAELLAHTRNGARRAQDFAGYVEEAQRLAAALYERSRPAGSAALLALLAQGTSRWSQIDNFVLRVTLHKREGWRRRLMALHRLTRLWWQVGSLPETHEYAADHDLREQAPSPGRPMREAEAAAFRRCFPGIVFDAAATAPAATATHRYLDAVDCERVKRLHHMTALARQAIETMSQRPHTRAFGFAEIRAENAHLLDIAGAVRWCSVARVEKRSQPIATLRPPFTVNVAVGGGHAEYFGFAAGRYGRILSPMTLLSHVFVLHCAADGAYVLLRDGRPVQPVEPAGRFYAPLRLPDRVPLQLVLWNIDGEITTQPVLVWEGDAPAEATGPTAKYTVIIPCTRYARRLQAALIGLARQDFDLARVEVIVAYVPGMDATDDVIDSMQSAYPELRIVRAPFSPQDARAKGQMINECASMSTAEWLVIMDADIVLGPQTFGRIEAASAGAHFIAPDGRKMLDRATTGRILAGTIDPSRQWEELLAGPGEYRRREAMDMPIGFLQCVRRDCFEAVRYEEFGHFEGADWRFAKNIRDRFGPEVWLDGLPVLHLDHGGSQWYGAQRHL